MDSLTQMALGAAVGTAVLGRRVGPRAALWGAVCGTLPDLDVLVPYGDPVRTFTFHRAESHALFWLTAAAPVLAAMIARVHASADRRLGVSFRDWWLLTWLALVTHPLLDAFTVYGTQLLLPFSDYPVGLGSVFIIDPLVTVPLLAGVTGFWVLHRRSPAAGARWNQLGLTVAVVYLGWTVAAQAHVTGHVHRALAATNLLDGRVLVTPTPFNTLLWRIVVMDDQAYHEGVHSLFDRHSPRLERHPSQPSLLAGLERDWTVRRVAWFSKGFYAVSAGSSASAEASTRSLPGLPGPLERAAAATGDDPTARPIVMTDLRMGQTPWFAFSFIVGEHRGDSITATPVRQIPTRRPPPAALAWLWRRIWHENLPPPPYSSSQMPET
jgi:inner membrane protein